MILFYLKYATPDSKNLLILFARDILGDIRADALAVPHFAQHAAIRRADALNRPI